MCRAFRGCRCGGGRCAGVSLPSSLCILGGPSVQMPDKTDFRHGARKSANGASRGVENLYLCVTSRRVENAFQVQGAKISLALRAHNLIRVQPCTKFACCAGRLFKPLLSHSFKHSNPRTRHLSLQGRYTYMCTKAPSPAHHDRAPSVTAAASRAPPAARVC